MKKTLVLVVVLVLFAAIDTFAQCAMCRATVGSNLSEGRNTIGTGLNIGILYLLVAPYLLVGCGIFFYRRAAKKNLREQGLL
jgi:uncharacterized protein YqgC (DUF456 family)